MAKNAFITTLFFIGIVILLAGCNDNRQIKRSEVAYLSIKDSIKAIPAEMQLVAYNNRDIESFKNYFSDDIQLIRLETGEVFVDSKQKFIETYTGLFESRPNLHCRLIKRIVCGNYVFDEEIVSGLSQDGEDVHATAIYEIKDGLIVRAWFVK